LVLSCLSPTSGKVKNERSYTSTSLYVFVTLCLIKYGMSS
jgi:hypothetical protein